MLDRAQAFIWRDARLLERHLFAHLFAGGPREPVLAALRAYRNADGGFGHGLEPDKRTPASQPIDAEFALKLLDLVGFDDDLVGGLCRFLETVTTEEGGVPFTLPTVRGYPHQGWWGAETFPASLNPTASIAGLLHKHRFEHPWRARATAYCWRELATTDMTEVHVMLAVLHFLRHAPDRARAERELARVSERILASGLVADPDAGGYVQKPLTWAPTPDSPGRRLLTDAQVERALDALAAEQRDDGGWPISWEPLSPASEAEWRGWVTIEALLTLRAYGRLPRLPS